MPDPRPTDSPFLRTSPARPLPNRAAPPRSAPPRPLSPRIEELRRKALGDRANLPAAPPRSKPEKTAPVKADKPARRASVETIAQRHARAETRAQLIERLTNPLLSLQEAAMLLNVCPATVRRWSNAGQLPHVRTTGNQRRFRWRDVQLLMPEAAARRRV